MGSAGAPGGRGLGQDGTAYGDLLDSMYVHLARMFRMKSADLPEIFRKARDCDAVSNPFR